LIHRQPLVSDFPAVLGKLVHVRRRVGKSLALQARKLEFEEKKLELEAKKHENDCKKHDALMEVLMKVVNKD
jgi:hypothetical protein